MSVRLGKPVAKTLIMGMFAGALAIAPYDALGQGQQNSASQNGQNSATPSSTTSSSIADAARRSREQAKNATKPSKVVTDDDLDKGNIKPGAQGLTVDAPAQLETQPVAPGAVAAAEDSSTKPVDPAATPAPSDDPEIAHVKESIALAEKDADFMRRELALQQDTFFSNPDHEHDTAGQAKLDAAQQEIATKQQDIDRLKARLATLQAAHHEAPAPPANPAEPPTITPAPAKP
jgi:hypothetical protein